MCVCDQVLDDPEEVESLKESMEKQFKAKQVVYFIIWFICIFNLNYILVKTKCVRIKSNLLRWYILTKSAGRSYIFFWSSCIFVARTNRIKQVIIDRPRFRASRSAALWGGNRRRRRQRWYRERSGKVDILRTRRNLQLRFQSCPPWPMHRSERATWPERGSIIIPLPVHSTFSRFRPSTAR